MKKKIKDIECCCGRGESNCKCNCYAKVGLSDLDDKMGVSECDALEIVKLMCEKWDLKFKFNEDEKSYTIYTSKDKQDNVLGALKWCECDDGRHDIGFDEYGELSADEEEEMPIIPEDTITDEDDFEAPKMITWKDVFAYEKDIATMMANSGIVNGEVDIDVENDKMIVAVKLDNTEDYVIVNDIIDEWSSNTNFNVVGTENGDYDNFKWILE